MKKFFLIVIAFLIVTVNPIFIMAAEMEHLKTRNTINDLLNHPAFMGIGQHTLPRGDDHSSGNILLGNVGSLLPYHSNVDGNSVVASINHMIDAAAIGKKIFYDFYTDSQKRENPSKVNTGLFFFRGKPGAPFAVICPGGGFSYVGSYHEGFPYAMELSKKGYNAFVLQYRVGIGGTSATQDLAAALSFIFKNADTLLVGTKNYSLWGSSAGARMVAYIGSNGTEAFGGDALLAPSAVIMAYTGHSEYTRNDPPTFAVIGANDGIASPAVMERRITAMKAVGIAAMIKVYPKLGHGFGLGTGTTAEGWLSDAVQFWEKYIIK